MGEFRHLGDDLVYRGYIWNVVSGSFSAPDGSAFSRDIVRSPGAVAVVPLVLGPDRSPHVVLVRQYRAAFDEHILEIPAGMRDVPDEDPVETARRELLEETGYRADAMTLLHRFLPSPGMTDAVLHVYLATGLVLEERRTHGPEEDHMEVLTISLTTALDMVVRGDIADAKATIGLLLAERHIGSETVLGGP